MPPSSPRRASVAVEKRPNAAALARGLRAKLACGRVRVREIPVGRRRAASRFPRGPQRASEGETRATSLGPHRQRCGRHLVRIGSRADRNCSGAGRRKRWPRRARCGLRRIRGDLAEEARRLPCM
jgi:hypothetical protein